MVDPNERVNFVELCPHGGRDDSFSLKVIQRGWKVERVSQPGSMPETSLIGIIKGSECNLGRNIALSFSSSSLPLSLERYDGHRWLGAAPQILA